MQPRFVVPAQQMFILSVSESLQQRFFVWTLLPGWETRFYLQADAKKAKKTKQNKTSTAEAARLFCVSLNLGRRLELRSQILFAHEPKVSSDSAVRIVPETSPLRHRRKLAKLSAERFYLSELRHLHVLQKLVIIRLLSSGTPPSPLAPNKRTETSLNDYPGRP